MRKSFPQGSTERESKILDRKDPVAMTVYKKTWDVWEAHGSWNECVDTLYHSNPASRLE